MARRRRHTNAQRWNDNEHKFTIQDWPSHRMNTVTIASRPVRWERTGAIVNVGASRFLASANECCARHGKTGKKRFQNRNLLFVRQKQKIVTTVSLRLQKMTLKIVATPICHTKIMCDVQTVLHATNWSMTTMQ